MGDINKILAQNTKPKEESKIASIKLDAILAQNRVNDDNYVPQGRSGVISPVNLNSQYDTEIGSGHTAEDINENRGQSQPWYDKAANGVINMSGRALTSGAEGILNPFIGTFYAIRDGKLASYIDNPFNRLMDEADKQIKETVPFYSTKEEQESHGLNKLLYANTYFRDALDGVGFTLGALGTGSVYSKLINTIGKTAMIGKAGDFINNLNKIEDSTDKINYIVQQNTLNKVKDGVKNGIISGFTASAEAEQQARGDADQFESEWIKNHPNARPDEIAYMKTLKDDLMLHSFAFNMPVISLDNYIVFGKSVFGNKLTDKINLKEIGESLVKDDQTYKLAEKSIVDKIVNKTYGLKKVIEPAISEGFFQEQTQYGISQGVNDYYAKKYNNPEAASFIESFGKGIYDAYGTKEGWDQGIIGALSGGLMGNITTLKQEGLKAYKNPKETTSVPEELKNLSSVKVYKDLVTTLNRHANLVNNQKQALKNNDNFSYENAKNDDFINYVSTKVKYGKTQDLLDELEQYKNMSEVEFKSNFGNDLSVDAITQQKQTVSQFVEDKINKVTQVQRAYDIINERFPNISEGNKERLAYSSLTIDNAKARKTRLNNEARQLLTKNINFVGNEGENNPLVLLATNYLNQDKTGKKLYKEHLLEANMNPMDLNEVLDKLVDIDKLEKREDLFVKEYKDLMNKDIQESNDKKDTKVEEKIIEEKSKSITSKDEETSEEVTKDISEEVKQSNPYFDLIEKSTSTRELDSITDQATKDNLYTPELLDVINKKRDLLLNPVETTKSETIKSTINIEDNNSRKTNWFTTFSFSKKEPLTIQAENVLNNIDVNKPEDLSKLQLEIIDIKNGTHNYEIRLNFLHKSNKIFLGFIADPTLEKNKINDNPYSELSRERLLNIILTKSFGEYSVQDLVNEGLITPQILQGDINNTNIIEDRKLISEIELPNDSEFIKDKEGNIIILDRENINKEGDKPSIINNGTYEEFFDNQVFPLIEKPGEKSYDRYIIAIKKKDGTIVFNTTQPNPINSIQSVELFNEIQKNSDNNYKKNKDKKEFTTEERISNDDLNSNSSLSTNKDNKGDYYISIPGAYEKGIKFPSITFSIGGGITLQWNRNNKPESVFLTHEELSKLKLLDDIIEAFNKHLKGAGENDEIKKLKALLGDEFNESEVEEIEPPFRLNPKNAIRNRINNSNVKDAATKLTASLNPKQPFQPNRIKFDYLDPIKSKTSKQIKEEIPLNVKEETSKKNISEVEEQVKREQSDSEIPITEDPLKLVDKTDTEEIIDINKAKTWLKSNLPDFIKVEDIDKIINNIKAKGITWGAFQNGIIYLNKNAGRGTEYHEAFHAIFRTLLSDSQLEHYLKLAKKERGRVTSKEVNDFKEKYSLKSKSYNDIENLIYEEYMADKFMSWKNSKDKSGFNAGFKMLFKKIADWFKYIFSNKTTLESLFYNIDRGYFKNSTPINNRFNTNTLVNKLIPSIKVFNVEGKEQVSSGFLNSLESNNLINEVLFNWTNAIFDNNKISKVDRKTKTQLLEDSINELKNSYSLTNLNRQETLAKQETDQKKNDYKIYLRKRVYSLDKAKDLITKEVQKRYKTLIGENTVDKEISEKEISIGNRWDLNAANIGGYGSISKAIKSFIGTTLINDTNEFGEVLKRTVDAGSVYNGLERTLANTPKSKMFSKLISYGEFNKEVQGVVDRLKFILNYDEKTGSFNDKHPVWKGLTHNFNKFKVNSLMNLVNLAKHKHQVFSANRRDIDVKQVDNWSNNHNYIYNNYSSTQKQFVLDEALKLYDDYFANNKTSKISNKEAKEIAIKAKKAFKELGFDFSEGYLVYSLYYFRTPSTIDQSNLLANFEGVNPIQISGISKSAFKDVLKLIEENKNPFATETEKEQKDNAYDKLKKLALANASFDETVGSSTYQSASGETVFGFIYPSHSMRRAVELQNPSMRNLTSLKIFKKNNPDFSDYEAETYYNLWLTNPLINSEFSSAIFDKDFNISLIGGIREDKEDEGKDFKSISQRDLLVNIYSMYGNSNSKGELEYPIKKTIREKDSGKIKTISFSYFYPKVLEASGTGYAIPLPIDTYFEKDKINQKTIDIIYSFFQQEFNRIIKANKEINNPNREITIKDYHNGKLRGKEFFNFKFLTKDLQDKLKLQIEQENNEIDTITKGQIIDEITKKFNNEFKNHIQELNNLNLITQTRDANAKIVKGLYQNRGNLLPAYLFDKEGELKQETLGNAYFNDLINTWSINQLLDGDIAYSRKDEVDWVKRNKGANAFQLTYGDGYGKFAIATEPIEKIREAEGKEPADAQVHSTLDWRIHKLIEKGRYNDEVKDIYERIKSDSKREIGQIIDNTLSEKDLQVLLDNQAMLISDKDVYYDGLMYIKFSDNTQTRQFNSYKVNSETKGAYLSTVNGNYYLPIQGREYYFKMQNEMEEKQLDFICYPTASKGITINVSDIGDLKPQKFNHKDMGMQQEVPSNKISITDGSQKNTLIHSENNSELAKEHSDLLAQRVKIASFKAFNQLRNNLDTDKPYTLKYVIDKFQQALEDSGGDVNLIDLFAKNELTGDSKYNLNMPITINKFEQFYYAHFTKDVLYSKAPGYTMVLVTSANMEFPINEKGNIIPVSEQEVGIKYSTRKLEWNEETGIGEVLIPKHFKEFGIKPGDNLSEEAMLMLGFRIPTEDKRSIMKMKVVDYLPEYYGSSIMGPNEIVLFSGADFDVDKMFIRRYEHFIDKEGKVKIFGKGENTLINRFNEYLIYETEHNKTLQRLIFEYINNDKILDIEGIEDNNLGLSILPKEELDKIIKSTYLTQSLKELGLPSTKEEYYDYTEKEGEINQGVINNRLLDTELALYDTKEAKIARKEVSDLDDLKDLANELNPITKDNTAKPNMYGLNGRMASKLDNDTGKEGIGIAAIFNMVFNELANNHISLEIPVTINGKEYKDFHFSKNGQRRVTQIAKFLAAMTDNAKERLASRFNLTTDTLGPALYMISLGVEVKTTMQMMLSPAIKEYTKRISVIGKSGVKSQYEKENYNSIEIINSIITDWKKQLVGEDKGKKLSGKVTSELFNSNKPLDKIELLKFFDEIKKSTQEFQDINTLLQLNKGFESNIADNDKVTYAIENLGLGMNDEDFKQLNLPFDARSMFKKEGYLRELLKIHNQVQNKVSKEFFLTQSKLGKHLQELVRNNIKKTRLKSEAAWNQINRDLLTYLTLSSYKQFIKNSNIKNKDQFLSSLNYENVIGDNSITQRIGEIRKENSNNKLLNNITIDKKGNISFPQLVSNSRTKLHPIIVEQILDGFQELYVEPKTRQIAIDLFNYLAIKDGLQFKNNSISKFIAAFIYGPISNNLDNLISEIKDKNINELDYEKLFGTSKNEFIEEYLRNVFTYTRNNSIVKKDINDEESFERKPTNSFLEDTPYIKDLNRYKKVLEVDTDEVIFDLFKNYDKGNKEEFSLRLASLEKSPFTKTENEINGEKKIEIELPLYLTIKNRGTFKLISTQSNGKEMNLIQLLNSDNKIISNYGVYNKVETFGVRELNPFSLNKTENNDVEKLLNSQVKNKQERNKEEINYLSKENLDKIKEEITTAYISEEFKKELLSDLEKVNDEKSLAELIKKFCK